MVSKRVWEAHKKSVVTVMLFVIGVMLCSCHVLSKSDLIKYAKSNYGDCTFVREEHKGSGNDAVRTVYLEDKETGIEYTVTSRMTSINIDGSNFGYQEDTSSDFEKLYHTYLLDETEDDLSKLESKYNMSYSFEHYLFIITFNDRASGRNAEACAKEFDETLTKYDVKNLRPTEYLLYVEGNVYIGSYDAKIKHFSGSNTYSIIDYVHDNYDADAVYLDSLGAYVDQFIPYNEVDILFPDHDGMPSGTAYYFKDKNGENFVAIDLADFGAAKSEVRLYRDTPYGMEEIDY